MQNRLLVIRKELLIDGNGVVSQLFWEGEKFYFLQDEMEPKRGEIEMNIGKLANSENSEQLKFLFWVEETFDDNIWSVYPFQVQYSTG